MLTVSSLLSNALLENCRVAAGSGGINNPIRSTGYFEWEQDSDIVKSFGQGEFVITTLYAAKDDMQVAEKCLKLLISNHVAAIAIKDVYYDDISSEIKQYANKYNVPLLFFSNTYIDDIIVSIHNQLSAAVPNQAEDSILTPLLFEEAQEEAETEKRMRKLNPFFYSDTIFAAFVSQDTDTHSISKQSMAKYAALSQKLNSIIPPQAGGVSFTHALATYKRGIFLISTANNAAPETAAGFLETLESTVFQERPFDYCRIGMGTPIHGFTQVSDLLWEAIYANTSCALTQKHILGFNDCGTDQLILPQCYAPHYQEFYENTLNRLDAQGQEHTDAPLLETALAFVASGGSMEQTANALFQHKNTIRYRINKISKLLNSKDEISFFHTLYTFSRLHMARKYLDVIFHDR